MQGTEWTLTVLKKKRAPGSEPPKDSQFGRKDKTTCEDNDQNKAPEEGDRDREKSQWASEDKKACPKQWACGCWKGG